MKNLVHLIMVSFLFFIIGCAHQINITPSLDTLDLDKDGVIKIEKNVGYYISPDNLAKKVITPGGGGDKVKYFPYKESEPVLEKVLSIRFAKVYSVPSLENKQFISSNNISYIFIPKIETDSSSRSSWIWPPSDFTVSLDCMGTDASGKEIWQANAKGEAHLGLPQVYREYSLAAKVATQNAFSKLLQEIINAEMLR